ncbi:MAG TPA: OmpH family outer membrane protein [Balneolaceae bacterium]|nr:OmpH family outer membrane protein [Balneolaceae bacterium]
MNTQEVMNQLPQRDAVQKKLNNFIQQKRGDLQQRTSAFQDSVAAFQKNKANMTDEQVQQEQQKLTQMESTLRQYQQNIQQQLQQRKNTLLQPIYNKMDQAISKVAKSRNLDYVINKATSSGDKIIYYASSDNMDITQEVINQLTGNSAKN